MSVTLRLHGERDGSTCDVLDYTLAELRSSNCEYLRSFLNFDAAANIPRRLTNRGEPTTSDTADVLDIHTGSCRAALAASVLNWLLRGPADSSLEVDGSNTAELLSLADLWCLDCLKAHVMAAVRNNLCCGFRRPTAGTAMAVEAVPQVAVLAWQALEFGIGDSDGSLRKLYDDCTTWMATWASRAWPTRTFAGLQRAILDDVLAASKGRVGLDTAPTVLSACRQLLGMPSVAWARRIGEMRSDLTSYTLSYIWRNFSEVCIRAGMRQDRSECWGALLEELRSHVNDNPDADAAIRVLPRWAEITRALLYGAPPAAVVSAAVAQLGSGTLAGTAAVVAELHGGGNWLGEDEASQMQDLYEMVRKYCVRHLPFVARCAAFRSLSRVEQRSILLIAQEGICAGMASGGGADPDGPPLALLSSPPSNLAVMGTAAAGIRNNGTRSSAAWVISLTDAADVSKSDSSPRWPRQRLQSAAVTTGRERRRSMAVAMSTLSAEPSSRGSVFTRSQAPSQQTAAARSRRQLTAAVSADATEGAVSVAAGGPGPSQPRTTRRQSSSSLSAAGSISTAVSVPSTRSRPPVSVTHGSVAASRGLDARRPLSATVWRPSGCAGGIRSVAPTPYLVAVSASAAHSTTSASQPVSLTAAAARAATTAAAAAAAHESVAQSSTELEFTAANTSSPPVTEWGHLGEVEVEGDTSASCKTAEGSRCSSTSATGISSTCVTRDSSTTATGDSSSLKVPLPGLSDAAPLPGLGNAMELNSSTTSCAGKLVGCTDCAALGKSTGSIVPDAVGGDAAPAGSSDEVDSEDTALPAAAVLEVSGAIWGRLTSPLVKDPDVEVSTDSFGFESEKEVLCAAVQPSTPAKREVSGPLGSRTMKKSENGNDSDVDGGGGSAEEGKGTAVDDVDVDDEQKSGTAPRPGWEQATEVAAVATEVAAVATEVAAVATEVAAVATEEAAAPTCPAGTGNRVRPPVASTIASLGKKVAVAAAGGGDGGKGVRMSRTPGTAAVLLEVAAASGSGGGGQSRLTGRSGLRTALGVAMGTASGSDSASRPVATANRRRLDNIALTKAARSRPTAPNPRATSVQAAAGAAQPRPPFVRQAVAARAAVSAGKADTSAARRRPTVTVVRSRSVSGDGAVGLSVSTAAAASATAASKLNRRQ